MREASLEALRGRRILVVEDEYLIAEDIVAALRRAGAEAVGPVSKLEAAAAFVVEGEPLDGALLDVNLRGGRSWTVLDALRARRVPVVLATGYGAESIPPAYAALPRCEKPMGMDALLRMLASEIAAA